VTVSRTPSSSPAAAPAAANPATPPASRRLAAFGLVGAIGFAVDAGLTLGLTHAGVNPFAARALAIPLAMLATYMLNRLMTFRDRAGQAIVTEGIRYMMVAIGTACFNWLTYSAALIAAPGLPPAIALVIASVAAMAFSYMGYSRFAFRG
jgi:putative flippase GtrA